MNKVKQQPKWRQTAADFWTTDGDCLQVRPGVVEVQIMDTEFSPKGGRALAQQILKCCNLAEGKDPQKGGA